MGNLRPETFAAINAHWSAVFGCPPHELWRGGIAIGTHGGPLVGYPGVYVLSARGTTRVSAPEHLVGPLSERLSSAGGAVRDALLQPDSWREWFGRAVTQVLGPSIHHYLDDPALLAGADAGEPAELRPIGDSDAELLDKFRAGCDPAEWSEGGFGDPVPLLFGAFRGDTLVAAANLTEWRGRPTDVGVLTHPEHRRTGLATALAALASRHALETGGLARYRAAVTNKPSLAIGRRLGYREYGRNLSVLLELEL